MKHKQAYIKLASLRLAINYVLRNRAMTKSASEWTNPLIGAGLGAGLGYLLSPEKHKLLGTLGGGLLGGAAGYGLGKAYNKYNDTLTQNKQLTEQLNDRDNRDKQVLDSLESLAYDTGVENTTGKNPLELISDIRIKQYENSQPKEEPVNGVRWVTPEYDIPTVIPPETVDYFNSLNPEIMGDPDRYLGYDPSTEFWNKLEATYPKYREAMGSARKQSHVYLNSDTIGDLLTPEQQLDAIRKGYLNLDMDSFKGKYSDVPQVQQMLSLINKPVNYTTTGLFGSTTKEKIPSGLQESYRDRALYKTPWFYFLSQADPERYGFLMDPSFYAQGFESPILKDLYYHDIYPYRENDIPKELMPYYTDWKSRQQNK